MITNKWIVPIVAAAFLIMVLVGCGGGPAEPTLEAAATPVPPAGQPVTTPEPATGEPTGEPPAPSGLYPVAPETCQALAANTAMALGVETTLGEARFEDWLSGESGTGCQVSATGTGLDFENVSVSFDRLTQMLQADGWQEDITYAAGGPGAILAGFRRDDALCIVAVGSHAAEESLCSADEPFAACWERLSPEQQAYTISLNCARGIAAAASPQPDEVLPLDIPIGFEFVIGLGSDTMPVMLPPDFPSNEGLPAIQPYVLTAEPDVYEISLDFGPECQGAGACHYGSLAGKSVATALPVSTQNFEFDAARAQQVTLARGIEGYFIESSCGASCDDAKIFWIYSGAQYMVGIKGASQADVLALANATLENSLP